MNDEVKELTEKIDEQVKDISYVAYEAAASRAERREKRHMHIITLLIILLVASNLAWIIYEGTQETVTETISIEGIEQNAESELLNNIAGGDIISGNAEN